MNYSNDAFVLTANVCVIEIILLCKHYIPVPVHTLSGICYCFTNKVKNLCMLEPAMAKDEKLQSFNKLPSGTLIESIYPHGVVGISVFYCK